MNKLKSKKFWISLVGVVVMLVQLLGVKIDVPVVSEIVNSVCAALVFFGLITDDGGTCALNGTLSGENAGDNPEKNEENSSENSDESSSGDTYESSSGDTDESSSESSSGDSDEKDKMGGEVRDGEVRDEKVHGDVETESDEVRDDDEVR